jgi:thiamine biosynthesis lipoprotein
MSAAELTLAAMGGEARLWTADGDLSPACELLAEVEARLTRFDAGSDLAALNADPREAVRVHPLVGAFVVAAAAAGHRTGGLVDATLGHRIVEAGYREHWAGPSAPLADALTDAPARHAASPSADAAWRRLRVSADRTLVHRPPGVALDSGGIGKGLAADLIAGTLPGRRFVADVGGDLVVDAGSGPPLEVHVEHPLGGAPAHRLRLRRGAVATSGIHRRLWRTAAGAPAHHLLDPATGRPAWTGLLAATAIGRTAVEAEALAKAALLSGPRAGWRVLSALGGVLVADDGTVTVVPALAAVTAAAAARLRRAA